MLTADSWTELARPLIFGSEGGGIFVGFFFVSFVICQSYILINVVIAVLLEKVRDGGHCIRTRMHMSECIHMHAAMCICR